MLQRAAAASRPSSVIRPSAGDLAAVELLPVHRVQPVRVGSSPSLFLSLPRRPAPPRRRLPARLAPRAQQVVVLGVLSPCGLTRSSRFIRLSRGRADHVIGGSIVLWSNFLEAGHHPEDL